MTPTTKNVIARREQYLADVAYTVTRLKIVRGLLNVHGVRNIAEDVSDHLGCGMNTVLSWLRGAAMPREQYMADLKEIVSLLEREAVATGHDIETMT